MDELRDNLDFFDEDVRNLHVTLQDELHNVRNKCMQERGKIVRATGHMKTILQQAEEKLLAENTRLFVDYEECLKRSLETSNQMIKEVESVRSKTDDVKSYGSEDHVTEENLKFKYDALQDRFVTLQQVPMAPKFCLVEEDVEVLKYMDVGIFEKTDRSIATSDKQTISFSSQRENDVNPCFPTALLWVNDMIIVSDKGNKKVKVFSEDGQFKSELVFSMASPYGVCHIRQNTFAVTLPRAKQIHFIAIENKVAKPLTNFNTHMGYSGLCNGLRTESMIATAVSNTYGESQVDIIGFHGEVFLTFKSDPVLDTPLFKFPRFVVANKNVIIISDWKKDSVIFLHEATGNILKEYKGTPENPLVNPYDLSLDDAGSVYILNGKDDSIHVLDVQCNLVEVITETSELISPRLIAYDSSSGRLAVSYGGGDIKSYHHRVPVKLPEQPASKTPPELTLLAPSVDDAHLRCPSPGF